MHQHQYVQHDWSPFVWAEMLTALAALVVLGLCLFLLFATRPQQPHSVRNAQRPPINEGRQRLARL